jgi:hypothetical protein
MAREVLNIMIENVILDTVVDGKRYVLRRDKYNWIWRVGNAELDDKTFFKQSRENSYFTSFEILLRSVLTKLIRQGMMHLDTESVLTAHQNALTIVSEIGEKLDKVSWGCLDRGIYCPKCHTELKGGG